MFNKIGRHKDIQSLVIFFLLALLFFSKSFLQNSFIWGFDTPKIIFPLAFLLSESFKHLQIPLWTPNIFFGFPIGSEGQIGLFYIFNLLHVIFPLNWVIMLLFGLHVFLAGIFTYFFGRLIGLNRFASIFAGIVFMFNGFIIAHFQYPDFIYAYAYLPLVLFLLELSIQKNKITFLLLAGLVFGIQLTTGHPNIPVMTFLYVALYFSFRLIKDRAFALFFKSMSILIGISIVVALPYLWLIIPLVPLSIKSGGVDFVDATNSSLSWFDFATFVFPNFFFYNLQTWVTSTTWHFWSYWGQIETTGYVGIITIFFIPFAFLKGTRKKAVLFFCLLLISLILALGKNTQLYKLFLNIPIFNGLRAPGRFLYLVDFSLALLAGFGITSLFQSRNVKMGRAHIIIISISLFIFIFVSVGYYLARFYPQQLYTFVLQNYSKLGYVSNLDSMSLFKQMILYSFGEQTKLGLIFTAVSVFLILTCTKYKNFVVKIIILVFIIADLFIFANKVNVWRDYDGLIDTANPMINKLKNELTYETGRVYTFNEWSGLMPDQLVPHHIPEAGGFVSLPLKRFEDWQRVAEQQWSQGKTDLFKIGSVRYLYTKNQLIALDNPLPRAYVADTYLTVKNQTESLNVLSQPSFESKIAIVESDALSSVIQKDPKISVAKIQAYQPNYVKILSDANYDGVLVLTDTNFPGWEVFINNKKANIYQTNYLFRGVKVQKGSNVVEFKYQPKYLNLVILVSFSAVFLILFYSALTLFKAKTNNEI